MNKQRLSTDTFPAAVDSTPRTSAAALPVDPVVVSLDHPDIFQQLSDARRGLNDSATPTPAPMGRVLGQ
jgi:hypothetical protein